ncbi:uncharacterized protein LOC132949607 [Metopolophium dirhodum]|uniref:uncharacterized protein LOC132949607 n=1 Tax=Metopolophium dirhodum TaxID=44670 RepID=UPI00298F7301|nr:uncharacterized protein LOC132949607 [Metopolophium dirhodum]
MANEKSLKESLLAASPFLIKVVEIILGLTSICLIISPYSSRLHTSTGRAGFVYSALSGAVLVDLLIVVSHFLQQKIPKKPSLIVSCWYGVMLAIAAGIIFSDWRALQFALQVRPSKNRMDLMISSAVTATLTSVTFFADFVLTFRYG